MALKQYDQCKTWNFTQNGQQQFEFQQFKQQFSKEMNLRHVSKLFVKLNKHSNFCQDNIFLSLLELLSVLAIKDIKKIQTMILKLNSSVDFKSIQIIQQDQQKAQIMDEFTSDNYMQYKDLFSQMEGLSKLMLDLCGNFIHELSINNIFLGLCLIPNKLQQLSLNLSGNDVSSNTCYGIASLLQSNSNSLKELYLNLYDNQIKCKGLQILDFALSKLSLLEKLRLILGNNALDADFNATIDANLKRKKTLLKNTFKDRLFKGIQSMHCLSELEIRLREENANVEQLLENIYHTIYKMAVKSVNLKKVIVKAKQQKATLLKSKTSLGKEKQEVNVPMLMQCKAISHHPQIQHLEVQIQALSDKEASALKQTLIKLKLSLTYVKFTFIDDIWDLVKIRKFGKGLKSLKMVEQMAFTFHGSHFYNYSDILLLFINFLQQTCDNCKSTISHFALNIQWSTFQQQNQNNKNHQVSTDAMLFQQVMCCVQQVQFLKEFSLVAHSWNISDQIVLNAIQYNLFNKRFLLRINIGIIIVSSIQQQQIIYSFYASLLTACPLLKSTAILRYDAKFNAILLRRQRFFQLLIQFVQSQADNQQKHQIRIQDIQVCLDIFNRFELLDRKETMDQDNNFILIY